MSKLEDSLGLPHHEVEDEKVEEYSVNDGEYIKDNLKELISQGLSSVQILSRLAKTAENPRAFEALATLMKTILDANKQYHEVTKPKESKPEETEGPKQIPKMTTLQLLEDAYTEDD